jgi:hypothetical protein
MCGLCGEWFRALAPHLRQRHEWSADDYRAAFGLNATRALVAPGLSARQSARLKERIEADVRVREGMAEGLALARAGELNRLGRERDRERGRAVQRRERTRRQGQSIVQARAEWHRQQREQRARELSFPDLRAYLSTRYGSGATVAALAAELHASESAVTGDMDRLGVARRPKEERLAKGRAALADQRARRQAALEARAAELGFDDLGAYLRDRLQARRWQRADVAAELALTVPALERLMRREGVRGVRGSRPAGAGGDYGTRRLHAARDALAQQRAAGDRALAAAHGFDSLHELYAAWRTEGLSDRAVAARLGVGEKLVRRLRRQTTPPIDA